MALRLLASPVRRALLVLAALASVASAVSGQARAAVPSAGGWDRPQQRRVIAAGLMSGAGSFAAPLGAAEARAAMSALASRLAPAQEGGEQAPLSGGSAQVVRGPVTVADFDRLLVAQLGLGDLAAHVQAAAAAAGLHPPSYFGTEVVVRFMELHFEHPVGSQRLDLFPTDPITRADAAWTLARTLGASTWSVAYAREALSGFALPAMTGAEREALAIAVSRIGYPYVWGGTTDDTSDGLEHGGFDCSGFAWRVFKVSGLPWGRQILGRTAAEQAGEIPRARRLRIAQLRPGDLLFFGKARFAGRATESSVIHEGIYLGENWVIHSSGQGVYVEPLAGGWLGREFAWGRRVIG